MFAKSKCLLVLTRTSRYVQSRSIRKSNHLKYSSSASIEGLSSQLQVKRNRSRSSHNVESNVYAQELDLDEKSTPESYESQNRITDAKKAKINELIKRAEEFLECRFHRSRTSPIGVGLSSSEDHKPYFNLLPSWFESDSSQLVSKVPSLLGSGHPILRLKQNLDPEANEHFATLLGNNVQWRAFIIMLVAKAFGHSSDLGKDLRLLETVDAKQRTLSEIAEMMHTAFSLHRTIVEIQHTLTSDVAAMEEKESSLHLGNKIAVLLGDLLLSRTSKGLSSLKNAKVTELMSDAISDFSESEILRRRQLEIFTMPRDGGSELFRELAGRKNTTGESRLPTYDLWRSRVSLDISSLIGRSCLCSTIFSQLDEGARNLAFKVGSQIGLVLQAYKDYELYTLERNTMQSTFDLSTLPVVFYLNSDCSARNPPDIHKLYRDVITSPVALLQTRKALEHLKEDASRLIAQLPRSTPAPQILEDFIGSLS